MAFAWERANPVGSLVLLRSHHELFGLAAVAFFGLSRPCGAAERGGPVYGLSVRVGDGSVGLMMAGVGAGGDDRAGRTGPVRSRQVRRTSHHADGLTLRRDRFLVYGIAPEGWIFCLGIPVMAFWGLAGPATQSLMTRRVSSSRAGTTPRRDREHQRPDRPHRPDALYPKLRATSSVRPPGTFLAHRFCWRR